MMMMMMRRLILIACEVEYCCHIVSMFHVCAFKLVVMEKMGELFLVEPNFESLLHMY